MLSERLLRTRPDEVRAGLRRRHAGAELALAAWLALEDERRAVATEHDRLAAERARLPRDGHERRPALRREMEAAARQREDIETQQRELLLHLPNLPAQDVPDGTYAASNVELRRWGVPGAFDFTPSPHDELAARLRLVDPERAATLAGARFPLLFGVGARLGRALAALMLDMHHERGYVEIAPPHLARAAILQGTGHLPHYAGEMYRTADEDLFLSPTAEVQLVGMLASQTLSESELPLAYAACTPAFRREAGSAGAATRGLLRQHQFDKVELVRVVAPEEAESAFDAILADAESVLQRLGLTYRVVALCAGELPFSATRTYDLEVWMSGQERYVEVSSISDCGTFQSRGLGLRYRPSTGGHARYPHTLNGSALAVGRTIAALLEQHQRADGSVALPEALRPYMPEPILRPPDDSTGTL
jgi:seryl-tRNA synthetase